MPFGRKIVIPVVLLLGVSFVPALSGCAQQRPQNPVELQSHVDLFSDEPPVEVMSDQDEFGKVTSVIQATSADELSFLTNFEWHTIEHYEDTKMFLMEGPSSSRQISTAHSLVDQLKFSEWIVEEDNSKGDMVDVTYWSEHGRLAIISNKIQTGINLQYANL